jgi:DNA-binding XRE family transcriptional regulator
MSQIFCFVCISAFLAKATGTTTMTKVATRDTFDYGELSGEDWKFVQNARDEIRRLGKQTIESICEIGRLLTEVKQRLPHGQWLPWLAAEFAWSETTARRFMDSYELFKSAKLEDLPRLLELPPSAVAELAARSTPEAARREVLHYAADGRTSTTSEVKETIHRHKVQRARAAVDRLNVTPIRSPTPPTIKTEPIEGKHYVLEQDRYGFYHRRPAHNATVVDIEWLKTGPIDAVSEWMVNVLGRNRLDDLFDALTAPEELSDERQMDIEDLMLADETPQPNGELRNGSADYPVELGRRVREARTARGWTQGELADAAGTHAPIISQIERGKLEKVGKATLQRVTHAVL